MFPNRNLQDLLALTITSVSVICLSYIAIAAVSSTQTNQHVLSAVLPLLASWVGTVLAYYFSKENFETAHRSVSNMVDKVTKEKEIKSIPVTEKMINRQNIYCRKESEISTVKIFNLLQDLDISGNIWTRLPILNDQDQVKYILHRTLITNFLMKKYNDMNEKAEKCILADLMLEDLIKDDDFKGKGELFVIVSKASTLAEAKASMDTTSDCKDIFVTEHGQKNEPMLGWITNAILMENAKL